MQRENSVSYTHLDVYKRQGKDAEQIISRINGFTFVETQYDYKAAKLNIVSEHAYSDGLRATVKCYGADDVQEGVAIMHHENVGVSITGNSTNPTRFQHPVAGTYKKECIEQGKKYFSVASGGGTGRTLYQYRDQHQDLGGASPLPDWGRGQRLVCVCPVSYTHLTR